MSDNVIITGTSMLSAIILENRREGVKEDELKTKSVWLFNEINKRGGFMNLNLPPTT